VQNRHLPGLLAGVMGSSHIPDYFPFHCPADIPVHVSEQKVPFFKKPEKTLG